MHTFFKFSIISWWDITQCGFSEPKGLLISNFIHTVRLSLEQPNQFILQQRVYIYFHLLTDLPPQGHMFNY